MEAELSLEFLPSGGECGDCGGADDGIRRTVTRRTKVAGGSNAQDDGFATDGRDYRDRRRRKGMKRRCCTSGRRWD